MKDRKKQQIPAFGNWENCDEMPITQYFETVSGTDLIPPIFFAEEDLFKVPVSKPVKSSYPYSGHCRRKANGVVKEKRNQHLMKQGRVIDSTTSMPEKRRSIMAVDEDLYKIPPELLYQKPKKKMLLMKFLSGFLNLNCIT